MPNFTISDLPPAILPIDLPNTFFEVQTVEAGVPVSRKLAGSNLSVATGINIEDAGVLLPVLATTLNFTGPGVDVVDAGARKTISILRGRVDTVVAGSNISVNAVDPVNPIVNLNSALVGVSVNGVTLDTGGPATAYLDQTGSYSVPAGGGGGQVDTVVGGTNISVDATDPVNPIVNLDAALTGVSVNGVTLSTAGPATAYLDQTGNYSVPAGGGSGITIQDEGTPLATLATTLNFVGAGVTATGTGATKTITIPGGGGGPVSQLEDGSSNVRFIALPSNIAALRGDGNADNDQKMLQIQHQDGTLRALFGYPFASGFLNIQNRVNGQPVQIRANDGAGSLQILSEFHPADGSNRTFAVFDPVSGVENFGVFEVGELGVGGSARMRNGQNVLVPVGYNSTFPQNLTGAYTFNQDRMGLSLYGTDAGAVTWTLPVGTGEPIGGWWDITNPSGGTIDLAPAVTMTLRFYEQDGTITSVTNPATITLPVGFKGRLTKYSTTEYHLSELAGTTGGGGGSPAGADTQIQFNNAGAFGASANLTWDDNTVEITNTTSAAPALQFNVGNNPSTVMRIDSTLSTNYTVLLMNDQTGSNFFRMRHDYSLSAGNHELKFESNQTGDLFIMQNDGFCYFGGGSGVFAVDIPNDRVRIQNNATLYIEDKAAANPDLGGFGQLYVKSADSGLYYKFNGVAEVRLDAGGGGGVNSVTGGSNITNSGTAADPVLDVDDPLIISSVNATSNLPVNSTGSPYVNTALNIGGALLGTQGIMQINRQNIQVRPSSFGFNSTLFININGTGTNGANTFIGGLNSAGIEVDFGVAVRLRHGSSSVDVVETAAPAAGGLLVNNQLTGAGLERVLTTSDGGGNVSNVGTPVNNQLAIWTGATTIEGDSDLTFDGTTLTLGGGVFDFVPTALLTNARMLLRNAGGGVSFDQVASGGNAGRLEISQTNPGGVDEDLWVTMTRNADVALFHNNVEMARTAVAASGGFEVNNTVTGAGFERVLTTSDLSAAVGPFLVVQAADQTVNNSTIFVNTQLVLNNVPSGIYRVDLLYKGRDVAVTNCDMKIDITTTGMVGGPLRCSAKNFSGSGTPSDDLQGLLTDQFNFNLTTGSGTTQIIGYGTVDVLSGTNSIQVQFAQLNATAGDLDFEQGSFLALTRLGDT